MKETSITRKKWRELFFPIKRRELPKFFSMAVMMFFILLNQNLIRGIKDGLVVTMIGAEALSFIKLFIEMPAGILFVIIYTILCNKTTEENIFRGVMLFFLLFFSLFGFFLFPNQELLHPSANTISNYVQLYPHFKWFFIIWGKWILVFFYMMGELWPMIIFTLLYWQLANKITKTEEASRFYFVFNLLGQANLLVSGSIMVYFSRNDHFLLPFLGVYKTGTTLQVASLITIVILLCILVLFLHRYVETRIIYHQIDKEVENVPSKLKLGLWTSFKMIAQSKYLRLICVLMISYSMVINLIEGIWLHETSLFYRKDPALFITYQGKVLFWTGIFTLICSFVGNAITQKLGWKGAALGTPIITLIMGSMFFALVVLNYFKLLPTHVMGISILFAIVAIGGLQNVLAKGAKYCFFDITKEMVYIPLDKEMRAKGKASVDILGGKIGKSAGAILQVVCYTIFTHAQPDQISPFLAIMFLFICITWIIAVRTLSKEYHLLLTKNDSMNHSRR
ncbi:Npt1/Npt2 family nucleotide transporter [Cardinium endosymbiont of Culicoides punctatus]|uniref:Npt1/Npt2 family nucleotide transporter n=1 Tax=Cardinium endosymbiont of Culicoides punctatus TaxID=2304601 RepID=UPI00105915CE|nr:NTP/NDP exchange transporter [Cardinium endosymbiont of Culicoides punctatus]TDG93346.1 ADP,ATP carrier protein 1 [Cardinium endosymbiont of Culicoides punctatus]